MGGHRRVNNVDYDDDDVEDYDDTGYDDGGAEEMSASDKAHLEQGTIHVRALLGPDIACSDQEIQESLWYYYFDVDKTASYLKGKYAPKPKAKKQAPLSRFDQAALNAAQSQTKNSNGPSPDDIVANAQAKGNKNKGAKSKEGTNDNGVKVIADGMTGLKVEGAQDQSSAKVKSKNLDVLKEFEKSNMKQAASFVVVGHVDHGKSTLMGRLLYDMKVVDQRSVDKLRREAEKIGKSSFALAWVMDETAEERSRGVTVDIATNYFETAKTRFTILDAPGHQDFIPNMIAGASQADFAVLVIDASTNSFEAGLKGQTKEHALLVRSIGVQRLIIAVNKMDTTSWSKARFEEITVQMTAFLTSAGFQQKNLSFIPCAGLTGENITTRVTQEGASWYTGPTLVEALDASETMTRALTQPLRLTISDIFRGSITNPLSVSGRLEAGSVQVGDVVLSMPSGETAAIKGIELETKQADWAVAGQIVTLHLADIDPIHLRIGDILCAPNQPIQNVTAFTAKVLAFEHMMPMFIDVFRGRLTTPAKVEKMMAVLDKASGQVTKKKPRVIKPGEVARVRVELDKPMPLEKGQRVVLRAEGNTIAAGLLEATEAQSANLATSAAPS